MRSILIIITALCVSLSAKSIRVVSVTVDHRDPSFNQSVSEGRTLLLLPIIKDSSFSATVAFESLQKPINRRNDRLKVSWYPTFKDQADSQTTVRLNRFESLLFGDKRLDIPSNLAVFESLNQRFVQSFRILESFSMTDGTGKIGKHLQLETEVWDTRIEGVVFRAHTIVETSSDRISDTDLLVRSVELLYATMPTFYFNSAERNW